MRLRPSESDSDERLAAGVSPGPKPRRGVLKLAGIGLLVVALIAGLVVYLHLHAQATARAHAREAAAERDAAAKAAAAQRVQDVKQAYLDYDAALSRMMIQASLTPLEPFLTAAGLQDEQKTFQTLQSSGYRYSLSSEHDMQVVVYSGGDVASVDDILLQRQTPLDPNSLTPVDKTRVLAIHGSYVLKLQGGRWLVDSAETFGSDGSDSTFGVSYAATSRSKPLSGATLASIQQNYLSCWEGRKDAYRNLDPSALQNVELPPALDKDTSILRSLQQQKQGFAIQIEHNARLALKDADTGYVYDTFVDDSRYFDFATKEPLPSPARKVTRETFELKRVGTKWKIDRVVIDVST